MGTSVNPKPLADRETTIGALLSGNGLPRLEMGVLLSYVLQRRRESVLAHPEVVVAPALAARFREKVERRLAGIPIAYLTGSREFYGIELRITTDVLVPRPETELLVDAALERIPAGSSGTLLDMGTGSGAIVVAIGTHRPTLSIEAIDASAAAVAVARENAAALCLRLRDVDVHLSDWYADCLRAPYRMIVSNPPYIRDADPHLKRGDVRHEPKIALVSGADGLDAIRLIIAGAPSRLEPSGHLMFEHGYDQGAACRALMHAAGFDRVVTLLDLAGIERVCVGTWPG